MEPQQPQMSGGGMGEEQQRMMMHSNYLQSEENPCSPLVPLDPSRFREMVERQKPPASQSGSGPQTPISSPMSTASPQYRFPPAQPGQTPMGQVQGSPRQWPASHAASPHTPDPASLRGQSPAYHHAVPSPRQTPTTPTGRSPGLASPPAMPPPSPYAQPSPQPNYQHQQHQQLQQQQQLQHQQQYPQHQQQYPQHSVGQGNWQHQAPMSPTYAQQMPRQQMMQRPPPPQSQQQRIPPSSMPPQRYGYPSPMVSPQGTMQPRGYGPPQSYPSGYPAQGPTSPQYSHQSYYYQQRPMRYAEPGQGYPPGAQMAAQQGMVRAQSYPQQGYPQGHQPQQFSPTYSATPQQLHSPQHRMPSGGMGPGYAMGRYPTPQQMQQPMAHQPPEMLMRPQPLLFYGHEPNANIPGDLCLLGCVFLLGEWEGAVEGRGDLGEIRLSIVERGGEVEAGYSPRVTHVLAQSLRHPLMAQAVKEGKRCVTGRWLWDVLHRKRLCPPWKAAHFPSNLPHPKPLANKLVTVTGFDAAERECLRSMVAAVGARFTAYLSKNNHFIIAKSMKGEKVEAGMGWKIPILNVTWLSELSLGYLGAVHNTTHPKYNHFPTGTEHDPFALDPAYFDRGGNQLLLSLMGAWRVAVSVSESDWSGATERRDKLQRDSGGKAIPHKRIKMSPPPSESELVTRKGVQADEVVKIAFTGFYPEDVENLSKKVEWLGGRRVVEVEEATVVVCAELKRSAKVLEAVARARLLLAPAWVRQSYAHGSFLDPIDFIVKDEACEKTFGFSLRLSLCLAKEKPLFKNLLFYLTPSVGPESEMLKRLVRAAGGKVFSDRPTGHQLAEFYQRGVQVIIVTCETDLHLCQSLLSAGVVLHSAELILTGILRQELDLLHYRLPPQHVAKPQLP